MKFLSFTLALAMVQSAISASPSVCNANNCARAVTGTRTGKMPDITSRMNDCSSFMLVTVTPATSTVTAYPTITDTTTLPDMKIRLRERQVTVVPSGIPVYASACSSADAYSSACACWGITATTTTAPTPVTTTTITVTATATTCPVSDTMCGTSCSNLQTSSNNCGQCNNVCPAGTGCSGGTCLCSNSGTSQCNGACPNYQNDAANCGSCGNKCPSGDYCSSGSCIPRCTAPPSTYSVADSTRTYALEAHTCANNPSSWILLFVDFNQPNVGCSGNTDEICPISSCATLCDATPGCVAFMVQSNDPNDGRSWYCATMFGKSWGWGSGGAIYGDEYLYFLQ